MIPTNKYLVVTANEQDKTAFLYGLDTIELAKDMKERLEEITGIEYKIIDRSEEKERAKMQGHIGREEALKRAKEAEWLARAELFWDSIGGNPNEKTYIYDENGRMLTAEEVYEKLKKEGGM